MATKAKRAQTQPRPTSSATPRSSTTEVENGTSSLDVDALRQIVEILEASDVTRLVWRRGRERLYIRRGPAPQPSVQYISTGPSVSPMQQAQMASQAMENHAAQNNASAGFQPAPAAPAAKPAPTGHVVTSPFVGTFYRTPAPDQPPFVELNASVKKGQVLCIIEAMKLMNEIESEFAGTVTEVLVENGQPVEYGQPLFVIE